MKIVIFVSEFNSLLFILLQVQSLCYSLYFKIFNFAINSFFFPSNKLMFSPVLLYGVYLMYITKFNFSLLH